MRIPRSYKIFQNRCGSGGVWSYCYENCAYNDFCRYLRSKIISNTEPMILTETDFKKIKLIIKIEGAEKNTYDAVQST